MDSQPESLTDNSELEDLGEQPAFSLKRLDLAALRDPLVIQAFAAIVVASLVLVWPQRTDRIAARLIGVALIFIASTALRSNLQVSRRRVLRLAFQAAIAALGIVLLLSPDRSEMFLGRSIGVVLVGAALVDVIGRRFGTRPTGLRGWHAARFGAVTAAGLLLVAFPAAVLAAATTLIAISWIVAAIMVIAVTFDPNSAGITKHADVGDIVTQWFAERPQSVEDRQALYGKVLYDGPTATRRVIRFFALMGFASVIASMGVITDSTAVVIGAMLIAPLMTPLMGMAMSLVMGWPHRLARSALVALGGVVLAIGVGTLLGVVMPTVIDTATNTQIVARASPTTLDLVIAVAAGAAGAFGLSRPDVSDSLPGVAIAISLVPPLTVVGIAYSQGDWASGNGALLLFSTNMLAILIVGGLMFLLTGVTPLQRATENQHRVRTSIAAVATMAAAVLGALLLNGAQIAETLLDQSAVESAVEEWLEDHPNHRVERVVLDPDSVVVTIVGPSDGGPTAVSLATDLRTALDRPVTADLRLIVEERDVATVD